MAKTKMKTFRSLKTIVVLAFLALTSMAKAWVYQYNSNYDTVMYVTYEHVHSDESGSSDTYHTATLMFGDVLDLSDYEGSSYYDYDYYYLSSISSYSLSSGNLGAPPASTEGQAVSGSPGVTMQALEAAANGGNQYLRTFASNILAAVNPQTYADALGSLFGFAANITDAGTRTQTLGEISDQVGQLAVGATWQNAAAYAVTPQGLADITSNMVLTVVPTAFGEVKIPTNIAEVNAAPEAAKIGATGLAGEQWLADNFGSAASNKHVYFNTPDGARYVDNLYNGVARESKVGKVYLTDFVKEQIDKDVYLRSTNSVNSVEWYFFDSSTTGVGGPSGPLKAYLDANGIPVYYNGTLVP